MEPSRGIGEGWGHCPSLLPVPPSSRAVQGQHSPAQVARISPSQSLGYQEPPSWGCEVPASPGAQSSTPRGDFLGQTGDASSSSSRCQPLVKAEVAPSARRGWSWGCTRAGSVCASPGPWSPKIQAPKPCSHQIPSPHSALQGPQLTWSRATSCPCHLGGITQLRALLNPPCQPLQPRPHFWVN